MAPLSAAATFFGALAAVGFAQENEISPGEDGVCLMQLAKTHKENHRTSAGTTEDFASVATPPSDAAFSDYVSATGRGYSHGSEEWELRHQIFNQRLSLIQVHNANHGRLWTAGISKLTDRTEEELAQLRGYRRVKNAAGGAGGPILLAKSAKTHKELPSEVDWRKLAMASHIPDQGACGSCWAVATVSMLQGRHEAQKQGGNRTFSAQQLVDCVPNPRECGGTGGCQGATVELAMQYIQDAGLEDATAVPYGGKEAACQYPMSATAQASLSGTGSPAVLLEGIEELAGAVKIGLSGWQTLPENQARPLMLAVMEGPVAISVSASPWTLYQKGIFDGCHRDAVVDHATTLFGFGSQNDLKYWSVRNSWGKDWGEDGFIRLKRQATPEDEDAYCGTDDDPAAGLSCKPYPEKVTVCGMCGMLYDSVAASFA